MPSASESESAQRRTVLAAVLAVQRGLITPDGAAGMIAAATPASGKAADAVGSILKANPSLPAMGLTVELERLLADPQAESALWQGSGLNAAQQETLRNLRPGGSADAARDALAAVARERVKQLRARLPDSTQARYNVVRELARGGMGRIMIANDLAVGREVAMKEVLGEEAGDPTDTQPEVVERFLREAKVTGQLEHPNIVPVYEINKRDNGTIYYTMKLVRGRSMADRLRDIDSQPVPDAEKLAQRLKLLEAFLDVCHAVAYAHSRGVIHRDLKPQNIVLGDFGETVVLDWGLARVRAEDAEKRHEQPEGPRFSQSLLKTSRESHTLDGAVLGTPAYMSPEQARGLLNLVDERSDIYALGAILYELLAGRPPYIGIGAETIIANVLADPPPDLQLAAPDAPQDLVSLARKAMARKREDRLESAEKLAAEIAAFRDGRNLSVHQYSSAELLRRFVARNKGAVSVGTLAAATLVVVILVSVLNIQSERDTAQDALAKAEAAEQRRMESEDAQQRELERLISQRRQAIADQAALVAADALKSARHNVSAAVDELVALSPPARQAAEVRRPEFSAHVVQLLALVARQSEVLRLAREPVAGKQVELMPPAEVQELERGILADQVLAARLATWSGDFGLAESILFSASVESAAAADARAELTVARNAVEKHREDRLAAIFACIRDGRDSDGSPVTAAKVSEYVEEVSAWRTAHTAQTLQPHVEQVIAAIRAAGDSPIWDVRKRLEIQFITGVLSRLNVPERSLPMLADLMLVVPDRDLCVELGIALCRSESPLAWRPLLELAVRGNYESAPWRRIRRHFWRVPPPSDLPVPSTAAEWVELARVFRQRGRQPDEVPGGRSHTNSPAYRNQVAFTECVRCLEAALSIDPGHQLALVALSRMFHTMRRPDQEVLDLLERATLAGPATVELLSWQLEHMFTRRDARPTLEEAQSLADAIVALDPDSVAARRARINAVGRFATTDLPELLNQIVKDLEFIIAVQPDDPDAHVGLSRAVYLLGRKDEALRALNRSLELDPEESTLWEQSARWHWGHEDLAAAMRDINRAITLRPSRHSYYALRFALRMEIKDFHGALSDANIVLEFSEGGYTPVFHMLGRVYEALEDYPKAIANYSKYAEIRPDWPDTVEVVAKIAELKEKLK